MKHASNWNGDDRTLCGIALDARESGDLDEVIEVASNGETVECRCCIRVINHCRKEFQGSSTIGLFRARKS
jgi:hypothetical protein